jgi:hypothetical protein
MFKMNASEIYEKTCCKCYLFKTEYCVPDGLANWDATTCKNFHTKESFESFKELYKKMTGLEYTRVTKNIFK